MTVHSLNIEMLGRGLEMRLFDYVLIVLCPPSVK